MNMNQQTEMKLNEGSSVGVIGGGPAGSFFAYFLLEMAARVGMQIKVDIYERRDFATFGPAGCNMCGGVISESLVQALSVEGINIPSDVVQRGIASFTFHTTEEDVTLHAPFREMRIATVYRGAGPKGTKEPWWKSFDGYLLDMAVKSGANLIHDRVTDIKWQDGRPQVSTKDSSQVYDLVAGAIGVNTPTLELFEKLGFGYKRPGTRKTCNSEFELGSTYISNELKNSMHAYLLNLPKLDFAAIIPKGDYVTMCLIGDSITNEFVSSFVKNPVVSKHLTRNGVEVPSACRCAPLASLGNPKQPYFDRVILLGDSGMTRLNKDGIGSAYRVAKTAATTALFSGISKDDFDKGYGRLCRSITADNRYGRLIFNLVGVIKKTPWLTRAVMRMARKEQRQSSRNRPMSTILWDMFTGSAPYREVFIRSLHPGFWGRFIWNMFVKREHKTEVTEIVEETMDRGAMGKEYRPGDVIVRQGEIGDSMYVIQSGSAEVVQSKDGTEVRLAVLKERDSFGEMAIFQKETRSATVRALTNVRAITIDRRIFLRRVHEDPSFVFMILQRMSQRVRDLNDEISRLKTQK
jgi:flavin-dependent dehydrogenase